MLKKILPFFALAVSTGLSSCKKDSAVTNLLPTEEYALANAGKENNTSVNLQQGLVAYYPFNGNANDASGNNNGTINGAILTKDRFLKNNKAFRFENGATITVPHNPSFGFTSNSDFSVSIWAFKTGTQDVMHLIGKRVQNNNYFNWQIAYANINQWTNTTLDGLSFATYTGGVYSGAFTKNYFPLSEWVHITAVYNNGTWSIYQNGNLVSTAFNSNLGADSNCNLIIGNSANYEPFYGALDDIRIYNRALNQSEIIYLANH